MKVRATTAAAMMVLAGLGIGGCGSNKNSAGEDGRKVVDRCEKVGQWCRISDGKLGLCAVDKSGGLACASQH